MNLQTLTFISITFSLALLIYQRADPIRRNAVRNFVWFTVILLGIYVWWRDALLEALTGLGIALLFNAVFWVLIGRYNPVNSSDEIRVLGMDD